MRYINALGCRAEPVQTVEAAIQPAPHFARVHIINYDSLWKTSAHQTHTNAHKHTRMICKLATVAKQCQRMHSKRHTHTHVILMLFVYVGAYTQSASHMLTFHCCVCVLCAQNVCEMLLQHSTTTLPNECRCIPRILKQDECTTLPSIRI